MITEQQRLERMGYIGGSDAAAILGLSPYRSAIELWLEKTGQTEQGNDTPSEPAEWGNILENTVAQEYARRTGLKIARVNQTRRHPKHDWMRANLDRRVIGQPEIVEIKTVRALGDEPRPDHVAQVRHYMAVTKTERAHLVYLVSGQRLQSFIIERDPEAEAQLIAAEQAFWDCVQSRTPPAVQRVSDWRILHPTDSGQSVTADCDAAYAIKRLHVIKNQIIELEMLAEACEGTIQEAMKDASTLISPEGFTLATWKAARPSQVIDSKRLRLEQPELAARYSTERAGSRRFVLKPLPEVTA